MGKKFSYEEVREFIESVGYKLLSKEYIDAKHKILVKCPNEEHLPYEVSFGNFKHGSRCPHCNIDNRRNNIEDIKKYVEKEGYKLITTEYKDRSQKLEMICPKGHTTFISWGNFKKDRRCSECYVCKKLTNKEVDIKLEQFGYKRISDYVNANSKMEIECPEGHRYFATYGHFYGGKRCPHCSKSNGETRVANYLNNNNLKFKDEYFITPNNNTRLRFDFYLKEYNLAIEYDGQQHFKPVERFGGEEAFWKTVVNDAIKNAYCEDNNIKLIRIPYWDFNNIEDILDNLFKKELQRLSSF